MKMIIKCVWKNPTTETLLFSSSNSDILMVWKKMNGQRMPSLIRVVFIEPLNAESTWLKQEVSFRISSCGCSKCSSGKVKIVDQVNVLKDYFLSKSATGRINKVCCLEQGDQIQVKVNKITSTKTQLPYEYYSLDYCKPEKIINSAENLGEVLRGDRIENSPYTVSFWIPPSFNGHL